MRYSLNDKSSKQTFGVNNAMFPTVPPPFLVSGVDVFGKAFLLGLCVLFVKQVLEDSFSIFFTLNYWKERNCSVNPVKLSVYDL